MNRKVRRRSSRSAAVYIPLGALMIILLTVWGTSGFLRVVEIEVDGATSYSDDEIIAASGISFGDHLFFMDRSAAAKRIEQSMPFINGATVSRVPPGAVRIEVTESTALAYIDVYGEAVVIDSSGRVLEHVGSAPAGLIVIRGFSPGDAVDGSKLKAVQGGESQMSIMLDVLAAFERERMDGFVTYLDVTYIQQIEFGYKTNYRIVLGHPNNLKQKLQSLPGAIADVEARYPEGVTGTLKAEQSGAWRWTSDN